MSDKLQIGGIMRNLDGFVTNSKGFTSEIFLRGM